VTAYDAAVIGAGANGLAAAALLGKAGQRVVVLERRESAGGTNTTEEFHPGYRANVCRDDPGWLAPALLRELELERHGLRVTAAPTGAVALRVGAPPLPLSPSIPAAVDRLRAHAPRDAEQWPAFCQLLHDATRFLAGANATRPPRIQSRNPADIFSMVALGRRLRSLGRRQMMEVLRVVPMPVSDLLDEWFGDTLVKGALATLGVQEVIYGPMAGGTALVFLHAHVGAFLGEVGVRRVVQGGVGGLVGALERSARAAGVEIRTSADVAGISARDARVTGVVLSDGDEVTAQRIVSSADTRQTFDLVDAGWLDPELVRAVDNVRTRGATARVHFALDGLPTFSGRQDDSASGGLLIWSPGIEGIERAADDAKYGRLPPEPALTAVIPSIVDPSLAPPGRHVLSVQVHHAAYGLRGGWRDAERQALGDLVELQLSRCMADIRERILARWVVTPVDLESRYGAAGGSLMHGELALDQFLFMRPVPSCGRYATPLRGLWLCGSGSHPASTSGAAGLLAAREILERGGNGR
jgi:phytoene dehydrogenase-like protein